jgi:hypothetical protein
MIRHKTYRGQEFNMGAFIEKNGDARAISNISMNARGDIVDKNGKVKVSARTISKGISNIDNKASSKVSLKEDSETAPVQNKSVVADDVISNEASNTPKVVSVKEINTIDGAAVEYEYSDGSIQVIQKNNTPPSL